MPSVLADDLRVDLLKKVSRSFYLSLRFLPSGVRDTFCLGYLAARASDTAADTGSAPMEERLAALAAMAAHFGPPWRLPEDALAAVAGKVPGEGESSLLRLMPRILACANSLPAFHQEALCEVLADIVTGQSEDLQKTADGRRFFTDTSAELDRYTYLVAGTVGRFWTRVSQDTLGRRYLPDPGLAGLHVEEGIRLGKALQLVNIIRDVGADERNGRRYLPRQEADAAGGWPDEPAAMAPFARKLADPWMLTTARHLQAGRRHVARIRHMRLRFATTLPLVLAWETLSCIRQASAEDWWNGVKVSRRRVRQLLPTCLLRLGSPRWLDSWLARYERNWNPPPEPA